VQELATLGEIGFSDEVRVVLRDLAERDWDDPAELMEIAAGIAQIGHAADAIRVGLAAARRGSLDDQRILRAVFPWPDRSLVEAEARAMGLDPYLLAAMARQESWFSPTARSRAGAVGYMQLMPGTAREVARRLGVPWTDGLLTVADANLHVGAAHLAGLLARYPGNVAAAVAAYNAGGRPVDRWRRGSGGDLDDFVERIGYPETQDYVRAVLRYRALYRSLYPPGPG
jgi:soluble lytic murein transglycosylase